MATLFLVSTPIGNLGDLTPRAADTLGSVARVLAEDTRRTRKLLTHLGISKPLASLHAHNEASREASILGWLDKGEDLAVVSDAGTPLVSDPGERIVEAVLAAGHIVVPIPGPSAILAALVASGLPAQPFTFFGFLPRKGKERTQLLDRIVSAQETTVLFESPERLISLLEALEEHAGPARKGVVARELTKLYEEFVRGTMGELLAHFRETDPRGEITLVLDPAPEPIGGTEIDRAAAEALALALLKDGMTPSRAARELARRLRVSRNRAYEVVQEVAGKALVGEALIGEELVGE
jgi:16S rRNA (cytidine1402-2'-O)-methyltransferase